jgi:AcrR family transcriptional regulator
MASPKPALRRDTRQTRDRLLTAVGELLAESGPTFGLPELARRAEVATATAYRHFETVHDAYHQYLLRTVDQLAAALGSVTRSRTARGRFDGACQEWAVQALGWGPSIVHIRNWRGFLQRLHDHDPAIIALYAALEPIVLALVKDKVLPEQDTEYAILIWITLFDERVILDLGEAKGWPSGRIARQLGSSVLAALGAEQAQLRAGRSQQGEHRAVERHVHAVPVGGPDDRAGDLLVLGGASGEAVFQHGSSRAGIKPRVKAERVRHVRGRQAGACRGTRRHRLGKQAAHQRRDAG